ncbi:MAG: HEAT repeat domain-containing protein [Gemmatimonadota bacterium]|nr:HEAT repeat domain-containing protein [Gemmatimonadota bacterium]
MKKRVLLFMLLAGLLLPAGTFVQAVSQEGGLEELARRLDSPEPAVRLEAVKKISVEHFAESLPYLVRSAADDDEYVRERVIQGLGLSDSPQAVEPVRRALGDRDEFVRWRAAQAAGRLRDTGAIEGLARCAGDKSWRVGVSALEALGKIGKASKAACEKARPVLAGELEGRDERVRLAAAAALASWKDSAALPALLELLKNGRLFVRNEAALALGELGDKSAVEPLIDAVADPRNATEREGRDWARWGAVKSLVRLTGQDFGENTGQWRQWWKENQ